MSEDPVKRSLVPIPDEPIPTYELTADGIREISNQAVSLAIIPSEPHHWRRFFLLLLLAAALVNYGIDVAVVRNFLETKVEAGSMKMGLEPYRLWAHQHPLTYDEVSVEPSIFQGKAAIWAIGIDSHGSFFEGSSPASKVHIAKTMNSAGVFPADGGVPIFVLIRIEGMKEGYPLVTILERSDRERND